jgi:hypothetical protein
MKFISLLIMIIAVSACENSEHKYQILNNESEIYRLNKISGEIVVIGKEGIQKYDEEYITQRYKDNSLLSDLVTDYDISFPESSGEMWTILNYKWRNDKIIYRFEFGPYSSDLNNEFGSPYKSNFVTLSFIDKDGFEVVSKSIKLNSLTSIVDESGKATHWIASGDILCSQDDYKLIKNYTLPWAFQDQTTNKIRIFSRGLEKSRETSKKKETN